MKIQYIYIISIIIWSCLINGQIITNKLYLNSESTKDSETGSINFPFKTLKQAFSSIKSNISDSNLLYIAYGKNDYDLEY